MKAYGMGITRAGKRSHRHACCLARNGCVSRKPSHQARIDRIWKSRARAEGKAACRED